jgi:maleylacetate reductase
MIVRWGLDELPAVLGEIGVTRPYLVASKRWIGLALPVRPVETWSEIPSDRVDEAASRAADSDGIVAVGGGSAIDTAKAVSAATGLPLVSIPTTYAGAEWTAYFGVRDPDRRMRGGGAGANPTGIVYEPTLTLELGRSETGGTAMNALAHCAEALYATGHNPAADGEAITGARLIADWLPRALEQPQDYERRKKLLEGAMHAGAALGGSMLALGHAMAQAVGGRYGLPHGTLNGICLPAALRFNAAVVPSAVQRFGEAIGAADGPAEGVEQLARLTGPTRLRELGVPHEDLRDLAEAAAERAGNMANPRPASAEEIEELLQSVW